MPKASKTKRKCRSSGHIIVTRFKATTSASLWQLTKLLKSCAAQCCTLSLQTTTRDDVAAHGKALHWPTQENRVQKQVLPCMKQLALNGHQKRDCLKLGLTSDKDGGLPVQTSPFSFLPERAGTLGSLVYSSGGDCPAEGLGLHVEEGFLAFCSRCTIGRGCVCCPILAAHQRGGQERQQK